jgi:thiamine kinase-like enzyme
MELDKIVDQILDEIKTTSSSDITRQSKIKRAAGKMASTQARKHNDSLYKRMVYFKDQYLKYREKVHQKYGPRVRSKARR